MGALIGSPRSHQLFNRNCHQGRACATFGIGWPYPTLEVSPPRSRMGRQDSQVTWSLSRVAGLTGHMGTISSGSLVMTSATLSQGSSLWVCGEAGKATQPDWGLQLLLLQFGHTLLHRLSAVWASTQ